MVMARRRTVEFRRRDDLRQFPHPARAGASKLGGMQDFEQVVRIEGAVDAFVFGAAFVRGLLLQQADGQAADGGEVRGAVAVLLAALVFAEDQIEHPVLAIFDRPVAANGLRQKRGLRRVPAHLSSRNARIQSVNPPTLGKVTTRIRLPSYPASPRHSRL